MIVASLVLDVAASTEDQMAECLKRIAARISTDGAIVIQGSLVGQIIVLKC